MRGRTLPSRALHVQSQWLIWQKIHLKITAGLLVCSHGVCKVQAMRLYCSNQRATHQGMEEEVSEPVLHFYTIC